MTRGITLMKVIFGFCRMLCIIHRVCLCFFAYGKLAVINSVFFFLAGLVGSLYGNRESWGGGPHSGSGGQR